MWLTNAGATPKLTSGPQRPGTKIVLGRSQVPRTGGQVAKEKMGPGVTRSPGEERSPGEKMGPRERAKPSAKNEWAWCQHEASGLRTKPTSGEAGPVPARYSGRPEVEPTYLRALALALHRIAASRAAPGSGASAYTPRRSGDLSSCESPGAAHEGSPSRSDVRGASRALCRDRVLQALVLLGVALAVGFSAAASTQYIDYEVLTYVVKGQLAGRPVTCADLPDEVAVRIQRCIDEVLK